MLQGPRALVYQVADLDAAKTWYAGLLGTPPYFDEPFYVGFNVGGYELGLLPPGDEDATDSPTTYWGVEDAHAEYARVIALGAKPNSDVKDVGDGILVASVMDPFGSIIGLIQNPHFKVQDAS